MADFDFIIIDEKKWESLPLPTPPKPKDRYEKILDALEAGEIVQIQTQDAKEMRGLKITLGRKSATRGFRVETRSEGDTLYVRKSSEPVMPKPPKEQKKKEAVAS